MAPLYIMMSERIDLEGLCPAEKCHAEDAFRLEELRVEVAIGIADIEEGRSKTFDSFAQLRKHIMSLTGSAVSAR